MKGFVKHLNVNVASTLKETQQRKLIFWIFLVSKLFGNGSALNFASGIK